MNLEVLLQMERLSLHYFVLMSLERTVDYGGCLVTLDVRHCVQ